MSRLVYDDTVAELTETKNPADKARRIHEKQVEEGLIENVDSKWRIRQREGEDERKSVRTFSGHQLACDVAGARVRPLIPEGLAEEICRDMHETTHPGVKTTAKLAKVSLIILLGRLF